MIRMDIFTNLSFYMILKIFIISLCFTYISHFKVQCLKENKVSYLNPVKFASQTKFQIIS